MTYTPTTWVDDIPPGTGTQVNAANMNKIEQQLLALDNLLSSLTGTVGAQAVVPIGAVIDWPYAAAGIPSWALLPYGQPVARATYAALHALVQAASYGPGGIWAGNGTTTFGLPDMRGCAAVGKDDMGGAVAGRVTAAISGTAGTVLGATLGVEGVALSSGQLPAHNHTATSDTQGAHTPAGTLDTQGAHAHPVNAATGLSGAAGNHGHTMYGGQSIVNYAGGHSHGGATQGRNLGHTHSSGLERSRAGSTDYGLSSANSGFGGKVVIAPGNGGTSMGYITDGESVDHAHAINAEGDHTHAISIDGSGNHQHGVTIDSAGSHAHTFTGTAVAGHSHGITVNNSTGGGGQHQNVQPSIIVNKFIRAL